MAPLSVEEAAAALAVAEDSLTALGVRMLEEHAHMGLVSESWCADAEAARRAYRRAERRLRQAEKRASRAALRSALHTTFICVTICNATRCEEPQCRTSRPPPATQSSPSSPRSTR